MRVLPTASLCIALACASCTGTQWDQEARRPQALLDAYLIAHGMAASYAESPEARPEIVLQLQTLDMKAAKSIRDLIHPHTADPAATDEAVAALTDFAARQSSAQ